MSVRHNEIILFAEVLADSASFVNCGEVSAALANLGFEVGPLTAIPVAAEIDDRCAAALLQAAIPSGISMLRAI